MSMDKLYPPKIDNILPAFTLTVVNGEFSIVVPYYLNAAIGYEDFSKIAYIIRSASSNNEIINGILEKSNYSNFNATKQCYELSIPINKETYKNDFLQGQHYKIQIAFIDSNNNTGYYSNAGIAKCVAIPEMTISQLSLKEVVGTFKDTITNEKVYSYSFELYDTKGLLVESSGNQLHNNANDTSAAASQDRWEIQTSLESDMPYVIKYKVTTINNYTPGEVTVNLNYYETIPPRIEEAVLKVENNFEEGYNRIYLYRDHSTTNNLYVRGNFYLLRASHKDNYTQWDKIADFQIYNWKYSNTKKIFEVYKDYFIEQGVSYRYAIQAYSNAKRTVNNTTTKFQIYSAKLLNIEGPIYSDFEDMFLYDGERQLKIRFNPKVSSFKPIILESKIDTIGSKYPYFFRNGDVNYKEFNLSGLISMIGNANNEFLMDEQKYGNPPDLIHVDNELSSYNYQKEREFKLEVLSWLSNGKEKILKTSAEGNYIIRLMNVTLTPTDTLGRMLHTFSAMAYEIASYDFPTLNSLGFLNKANQIPRKYVTKNLSSALATEIKNNGKNYLSYSTNLIVDQVVIYTTPGNIIQYKINGDNESMDVAPRTKTADIYGVVNLSDEVAEKGLRFLLNTSWDVTDTIEYSYFNQVKKISDWYWAYNVTKGTLTFTETGLGTDISMKKYLNDKNTTITTSDGVTTVVQNAISSFPYIAITKKQIINIYKKNNKYYSNSGCTTQINKSFVENHQGKIFKIKDTDTYVLVTINGNTLSYEEILGESGVFYIITETDSKEKLTYLGDLESNNKKVYRDLYDFKLGQGLVVNGSSPKKVITAKNNSDYSYAI